MYGMNSMWTGQTVAVSQGNQLLSGGFIMALSRFRQSPSFRAGLFVCTMGAAALLAPTAPAVAYSLNVTPASCQTASGEQIQRQWFYIMNPASHGDVWAICPIPFDNDTTPSSFTLGVTGAAMPGASSEQPTCFLTANSSVNTVQPPYVAGTPYKYVGAMTNTQTSVANTWGAAVSASKSTIQGSVNWMGAAAMNLLCKLPGGYGISWIGAYDGSGTSPTGAQLRPMMGGGTLGGGMGGGGPGGRGMMP